MGKGNVHLVLNSRDRVSGTYNSAEYASLSSSGGQNLIQGDIKDISVTEVNFPYDIPNIQEGSSYSFVNPGWPTNGAKVTQYATFFLQPLLGIGSALTINPPGEYDVIVTIAPGFYSADDLKTAINAKIEAGMIANGQTANDGPTFDYEAGSNRFIMNAPVTDSGAGNVTPAWALFSPYTFGSDYLQPSKLGKDLLTILGFTPDQKLQKNEIGEEEYANYVNADGDNTPVNGLIPFPEKTEFYSGSAPLSFTQYVDICSPKLCKFQYFRDGSTTNLARRSDLICRLYIANNIATQAGNGIEGSVPFIINRQFQNARVMRWTADNSVGNIDISLYDDIGQPLLTTWNPRNFQITFNVKENGADEGADETLKNLIQNFAPYKDRNAGAWNNLRSIN